jgi:2,4-dienoyl-CoA reductase-like NADH-dependent reductase (Old Yellow Enzyme family)
MHTHIPNFHDAQAVLGWRNVVNEVHAAGGKIAPQLWHVGSKREPGSGPIPEAASEGPMVTPNNPLPMSDRDIADTIDAFATAAALAKECEFDAVALHFAHGYLVDQFLWEGSNRREDSYAGDPVRRTKFAQEIVGAVRRAVGRDFPIIARFSQWKLEDYEAKLAETPAILESILAPLVDAGVDIFDASTRRFWVPEFAGSDLNLAGWTKKVTGKPTITVGSVGLLGPFEGAFIPGGETELRNNLPELIKMLERGDFDLVAVGRALITNPDWAAKVRDGRFSELVPFYDRAFEFLGDDEIQEIVQQKIRSAQAAQ